MNKRRSKKAYRKMMEGKPLKSKENTAVFNNQGDFKDRLIKQLGLNTKEWYFGYTKNS